MPVIDKIDNIINTSGGREATIDLRRMRIVNNKFMGMRIIRGRKQGLEKLHISYENVDIIVNPKDYDDIHYILYNVE
jgi:hypothetical protein